MLLAALGECRPTRDIDLQAITTRANTDARVMRCLRW
jgi:hypothetical protein